MAPWFRQSRDLIGDILSQGWISIRKKAECGNDIEGVLAEIGQGLPTVHFMERHRFAFFARQHQHVGGNVDGMQLAIRQVRFKLCRDATSTGREIQHAMWCETHEYVAKKGLLERPHCRTSGPIMEACLISLACSQMTRRVLRKLS